MSCREADCFPINQFFLMDHTWSKVMVVLYYP